MKLLLDRGAQLNIEDPHRRTPLLLAASNGHEAIVKQLLKRGAELEAKDSGNSWTSLSWAAGSGHRAVVMLLLEAGAQLNTKDGRSRTPL